jgi:hypothetical protein
MMSFLWSNKKICYNCHILAWVYRWHLYTHIFSFDRHWLHRLFLQNCKVELIYTYIHASVPDWELKKLHAVNICFVFEGWDIQDNYTLYKNAGFWLVNSLDIFLQIQALHCEFAECLLHVGVFA